MSFTEGKKASLCIHQKDLIKNDKSYSILLAPYSAMTIRKTTEN